MFSGGYYETYRTTSSTIAVPHTNNISASTQINVGNLSPWITSIFWNPLLTFGETLAYSVQAYDPAGVGSNEYMTFEYDFDSDGIYESSQGGSLTSGGNYLFTTLGHHSVRIRVSDGLGGYGYASFNVEVEAPPEPISSPVPEPASLAMWGLGAVGMMFARRRRKQQTLAV